MSAAAAAAASEFLDEQSGVCKGVSVYALQAKATARVDVPETPKLQGQRVKLEEKVKQSFPVLLRTLQGRHRVMSCTADMLIADLHEQVAILCCMPCEKFMLFHRSKIVQGPGSLGEWGIERDVTLTLRSRMLGGSGIPGEWHCASCNRGGCWHTVSMVLSGVEQAVQRVRKFCAVLLRGFSQPGKGSGKGKGVGKGSGNPLLKENSAIQECRPLLPGPQFSHAPTFHAPRPNKRKQTDTSTSVECLAPSGRGTQDVGLLSRHFGHGEIQSG